MDELEAHARRIMDQLDPALADDFVKIVQFSEANESLRVFQRKSKRLPDPQFGTTEHLEYLARKLVDGRRRKPLPRPKTKPDPALSTVMTAGYGKSPHNVEQAIEDHRTSMVAENVIGELLERYINEKIDNDWVWCAGEVVRSVDFIRQSKSIPLEWESLQIKNRDNSENSSSSAIRKGTEIKKWHRSIARTGRTRWEEFPVREGHGHLSEDDFQDFVKRYLAENE